MGGLKRPSASAEVTGPGTPSWQSALACWHPALAGGGEGNGHAARNHAAVSYDEHDIDHLVEGTMKQQRLLATSPKIVTEDDVAGILRRSMNLW